jgi:hypothetical protein
MKKLSPVDVLWICSLILMLFALPLIALILLTRADATWDLPASPSTIERSDR